MIKFMDSTTLTMTVTLLKFSDEKYTFASLKKIIQWYHFPPTLVGQAILNKDPTVWPDGARPANTCIPLSYPGNVPVQLNVQLNPQTKSVYQ
jgi:hypothetical protein